LIHCDCGRQLSAIDAISIVKSQLQQFDCGVQANSIRLFVKIKHTLKLFFFLQFKESESFKRKAKNIAENVGSNNTYRLIPNNIPLSSL
jgi:hypothetical protein